MIVPLFICTYFLKFHFSLVLLRYYSLSAFYSTRFIFSRLKMHIGQVFLSALLAVDVPLAIGGSRLCNLFHHMFLFSLLTIWFPFDTPLSYPLSLLIFFFPPLYFMSYLLILLCSFLLFLPLFFAFRIRKKFSVGFLTISFSSFRSRYPFFPALTSVFFLDLFFFFFPAFFLLPTASLSFSLVSSRFLFHRSWNEF